MRSVVHSPDYTLLSFFGILLIFGLIMLTSASSALGYERFADHYFFIKRQMAFGLLPGALGFLFFAKLPLSFLKKIGVGIFYISIILLVVVLIPGVGFENGTFARSWIRAAGFSFQPAEIAKLGLIFFLSLYLAKHKEKIQNFKNGFLPALGFGLIPLVLLMLQPDTGTAVIVVAILFGMLFVAGARLTHLSVFFLVSMVAFTLMILVAPYRTARFTTFLHPELDPQGIGYHINQASLAIGSGGILGLGYGHSRQKFQYLPEVHADSIFAIMAEEMGFIVVTLFIGLLVAICLRGFKIAKQLGEGFSQYLVSGILIWFAVQSFFNIAAMLGILPITGLPLPFVSHGGTALVVSLVAVGVIINVSKYRRV